MDSREYKNTEPMGNSSLQYVDLSNDNPIIRFYSSIIIRGYIYNEIAVKQSPGEDIYSENPCKVLAEIIYFLVISPYYYASSLSVIYNHMTVTVSWYKHGYQ